jgi:hypothetical protein
MVSVSGPSVIVHDQTIPYHRSHPMSSPVTMRNTKAELMAAVEAQAAIMQSGPTWGQIAVKASQFIVGTGHEITLFATDCHRVAQVARTWYDQVTRELSRPLLKP